MWNSMPDDQKEKAKDEVEQDAGRPEAAGGRGHVENMPIAYRRQNEESYED